MGISREQRVALEQQAQRITSVSDADYSMTVRDQVVNVTLTGTTNSTVTLPSVAQASDMEFVVRLAAVGSGRLIVQDLSNDAGLTDVVITAANGYATFRSTGRVWIVEAYSGTIVGTVSGTWTFVDDFNRAVMTEDDDSPWILNKGADAQALDPVINLQSGGVVRLTTGDADGTMANDGSQLVLAIPSLAQSGGLVFETRLHINTAITTVSVFAGLTDSTALEEAFSNASDVITSTASDGCGFLYDTGATTATWWALAVDSDADDTGNASTGTAPVADTYQTLRMEVSSTGNEIRYYINGTLVKTLTGAGVSPDVALYATVSACATTTTSKTVDVDYIAISHTR